MKKILTIIIFLSIVLCLSSCKDHVKTGEDAMVPIPGDNWVALCSRRNYGEHCHTFIYYFYDKDTEIVYMYSEGLSAVYNKDGKPMTKTEFNNVHVNKYHDND